MRVAVARLIRPDSGAPGQIVMRVGCAPRPETLEAGLEVGQEQRFVFVDDDAGCGMRTAHIEQTDPDTGVGNDSVEALGQEFTPAPYPANAS